MGAILLPHQWRQQPQCQVRIDWENPLVQAIRPTYVYAPGVGLFYDAVSGGLVGTLENVPTRVVVQDGYGLMSAQTTTGTIGAALKTGIYPDSSYTFLSIISTITATPVKSSAGYTHGGSHDGTRRFYVTSLADNGTWSRTAGWGSGFVQVAGAAIVAPLREHLTLVKPITGNPIFYNNGVQIGTISAPTFTGTSTRQIYFGKRTAASATEDGSVSYGPENVVSLVIVGKGSPRAGDVAGLYENPWQIFAPLQRRIWVPVSGGVTSSASPGSLSVTGSVSSGYRALLSSTATSQISVTGYDATSTKASAGATTSIASPGSYDILGHVASSTRNLLSSANVSSVNISGFSATSSRAITSSATAGSIIVTAEQTSSLRTYVSSTSSGQIAITGYTANSYVTTPLTDSQKIDLILDVLSNKQTLDPVTGIYTLYADDGTTVLYTAQGWEDVAGTITYRGGALQRLDKMQ